MCYIYISYIFIQYIYYMTLNHFISFHSFHVYDACIDCQLDGTVAVLQSTTMPGPFSQLEPRYWIATICWHR